VESGRSKIDEINSDTTQRSDEDSRLDGVDLLLPGSLTCKPQYPGMNLPAENVNNYMKFGRNFYNAAIDSYTDAEATSTMKMEHQGLNQAKV